MKDIFLFYISFHCTVTRVQIASVNRFVVNVLVLPSSLLLSFTSRFLLVVYTFSHLHIFTRAAAAGASACAALLSQSQMQPASELREEGEREREREKQPTLAARRTRLARSLASTSENERRNGIKTITRSNGLNDLIFACRPLDCSSWTLKLMQK